MVRSVVPATVTMVVVAAAFPVFVRGALVVLNAEFVSWDVLVRHLRYIAVGLAMTTLPILAWMLPRFPDRIIARRLLFLHAFFGVQAYALLLVGLTGIYRIFQEKRRADLYRDPDPDANLDDLHPNMGAWRSRLRLGVFGYLVFWILSFLAGSIRYYVVYWS